EVPSGYVGGVEELLSGGGREPRPCRGVDWAADRAKQSGVVDHRWGHQLRTVEEFGMPEDRLDHGADAVAGARVDALERRQRRFAGRIRDKVAPQLADEERRVERVGDAQAHRVLVV